MLCNGCSQWVLCRNLQTSFPKHHAAHCLCMWISFAWKLRCKGNKCNSGSSPKSAGRAAHKSVRFADRGLSTNCVDSECLYNSISCHSRWRVCNSAMSSAYCSRELKIIYSIMRLSPAKIYVEHFTVFHKRYEGVCVIM